MPLIPDFQRIMVLDEKVSCPEARPSDSVDATFWERQHHRKGGRIGYAGEVGVARKEQPEGSLWKCSGSESG